MGVLNVTLFGRFAVRCGDRVLTGLLGRKAQELFCYLMLNRDRPLHREILAELLCGDNPSARSRKCLRQALWQLQAVLRAEIAPLDHPVLLVEPDWIKLNPAADLWLDVAVFEQAFGLVRGMNAREIGPQPAQALRNAAELYLADLLPGWYQDWCVYERERFQQMYLAMLDKLMDYCEAHREYEMGLLYGVRSLRYDEARERTHRKLMRLYYLSGDRTSALRQYERCVVTLEEQLEVRPAKRTEALYEQIRTDRVAAAAPG